MSKLSKQQVKQHNAACTILEKDILSYDDKIFVLENWNEGATQMNGQAGAFFTPIQLARDFQICVNYPRKVIDLCAGIGMLGYYVNRINEFNDKKLDLTCVELNKSYIEVGKKILPNATWIEGSVLDMDLILSLGHFDQSISNPPFGNIKTGSCDEKKYLKYTGSSFELKVVEIASMISNYGTFILPQNSTPFRYSGVKTELREESTEALKKFIKQTGIEFEMNMGIDTSVYLNDWKGVTPMCEIVLFDFASRKLEKEIEEELEAEVIITSNQQLSLFD